MVMGPKESAPSPFRPSTLVLVTRRLVERIGSGDALPLATEVGRVPANIGALLVLDAGADFDPEAALALLARRAARIPRFRQRLVRAPLGLGRPYWVEDPSFDPSTHLATRTCAGPDERTALLRIATDAVTRPLPRSRPLWRAILVTGLAGGRVGLVVALHHALADGIGGLALLHHLTSDVAPVAAARPPVPPPPTRRDLFADASRERLDGLRRLPAAVRRIRGAGVELGLRRTEAAPRCSLNVPTGPRRLVTTVAVDLAAFRDGARRHGATLNDGLLVAVTSAMDGLLRERGEHLDELVVSVPIAARAAATVRDLGNQVGVMPARVPLRGGVGERLERLAASTRGLKTPSRGASAAILEPAFRALSAVGLVGWFIDHQHLVNSFLSNVRGPAEPLRLAGARVTEIVPVTLNAGNVAVSFASLSYAGALTVSITTDPDAVPETASLTDGLRAALEAVARA